MEDASDCSNAISSTEATNAEDSTSSSPFAMPTPQDLLKHIPIGHPDTMMSKESVRRAVEEFQVRPSDVIVATPPKTGTTLVTWICHLLRTNAAPIREGDDGRGHHTQLQPHQDPQKLEQQPPFETIYEFVPWPTLSWDIGYDPNVQGSEFWPRVFKSHLRMASIYPGCKYVVTVRDPTKTTISFYNFFLAKKVPFLLGEDADTKSESELKPIVDVSTFLMDMPFVQGSEKRPSLWDYYAEYHALLECPSVLILVYEDFLRESSKKEQIRRLTRFLGTPDSDDLIERVAALSTKEYMGKHVRRFDEPYERAKKFNRAGDITHLTQGAKVALGAHPQVLNEKAEGFLEDRWRAQMGPLGYKDYGEFAASVRERNDRMFGSL